DRQLPDKPFVNLLDFLLFQSAAADIWLIGRDNEKKSNFFKKPACFGPPGQDFELFQAGRRIRLAITNQGSVDNTVTIQKDGPVFKVRRLAFAVSCLAFGVQGLASGKEYLDQ